MTNWIGARRTVGKKVNPQTNLLAHVVANHALDCVHYLFAVISIREICGLFIKATILVIKWR